ncbi:MAG: YceI family protein [Balneolaceae bacterium]
MRLSNTLLLSMLLCVGTLNAQTFQTESGTAVFHSQVPLHSFSGTSDHLIGMINLDDNSVDFYLDLETLETGIGKRDRDMRETLETEEFPFAEFFGELTSEFDINSDAEQPVTASGKFTIHGVENDIEVEGTLQKTNEGLLLKADWILLLKDYDIEPPSLLFVKVDQEQKIEIEALLKPVDN